MLRASNRPLLAFFEAIKNLRLRQLKLILKAGFDPNVMINTRGQNGLQFMVNYFNATDAHFRLQAPINKAAYMSIAKLLLDSGLDPNAVDLLSGETVAYEAIRLNDMDMVNLLLHYTDFTHRNKNGETILMCAARFGSKQTMRLILEHLRTMEMDGYFLRQRNKFGLSALELARAENIECAKVLTKHLIGYGAAAGAGTVLARSSSQHQLRAFQMRPGGAGPVGPCVGLIDDSASDLSDSELIPTAYQQPRGSLAGTMLPSYKTSAGVYDPRAAEFNQYLLEQQHQHQQEPLGKTQLQPASVSDDDDYFALATGSGPSGLTRSRSCMLGPSSSSLAATKGFKYSGKKGKPTHSAAEPNGTPCAKQPWEGAATRNPSLA